MSERENEYDSEGLVESPLNGDTDYTAGGNQHIDVETDTEEDKCMIYGVNDVPPVHITIICALQVSISFFQLFHCCARLSDRSLEACATSMEPGHPMQWQRLTRFLYCWLLNSTFLF